jgi:hypothetical protein
VPILDFHVHVCKRWDWRQPVIDFVDKANPDFYQRFPVEVTGEGLLDYLTEQQIDRAVILAEYAPKTTGIVPNDFVAEICRVSRRLIPFGCVSLDVDMDPAAETERCVKQLGFRGLKLMPSYCHFYPNDPGILPAYEVAQDLGIPVMFHTGTSLFPGSRIKYAHPLLLDDIADAFPDLTIIMSHGGRPFWYKEAEWLLRRHRNTYIDLAGIPPKHVTAIFPKIEELSDRFVFGSDWPAVGPISRQILQIQELRLSPGIIEKILWGNGARILGINS